MKENTWIGAVGGAVSLPLAWFVLIFGVLGLPKESGDNGLWILAVALVLLIIGGLIGGLFGNILD